MYQDIERVLLSREEIAGKVAEIGKALSEEYRGKTPLVVCLLLRLGVTMAGYYII